jgi:hypothetical protein
MSIERLPAEDRLRFAGTEAWPEHVGARPCPTALP